MRNIQWCVLAFIPNKLKRNKYEIMWTDNKLIYWIILCDVKFWWQTSSHVVF